MSANTFPEKSRLREIESERLRRNSLVRYADAFREVTVYLMPLRTAITDHEDSEEAERLILPSNADWRHRVYYGLVELQRECDAEIAARSSRLDASADPVEEDKDRHRSEREIASSKESITRRREWEESAEEGRRTVYPYKARPIRSEESAGFSTAIGEIAGSMTEARVRIGWRLEDLVLAARVLGAELPPPSYSDEAQMRRVFGLVYDVLRYRNVLTRVLEEVEFWRRNSAIGSRERIVWLLLYDMLGRKFAGRGDLAAVKERERIFQTIVGLREVETALLKVKTRLAASFSRLRIGGSALSLDELLPIRLRVIEGVAWGAEGSTASGWINTLKLSGKEEFIIEMSKLGLVFRQDRQLAELGPADYVLDPFCPKVVILHEAAREKLAISALVREHRFVFLERSMCAGAAAMARAIRAARLCGPVVLTHSVAPRHTGYLAGLLADIEDAGRLLAFGAADRRTEYETYLEDLGFTSQHCRVFSERYASPPVLPELERATVVLAVPPSSCTGLRDIVDLAVARGGDARLLESVTDDIDGDMDGDIDDRPRILLADQLSTLKYALARPNVQFLLYEVHTTLPSETTEMIGQVVDYANRLATETYIRDHPPRKKPSPPTEGKIVRGEKCSRHEGTRKNSAENEAVNDGEGGDGGDGEDEDDAGDELDEPSLSTAADLNIPASDLFEVGSIEDIYGEKTDRLLDPGCFLSVVRRKEMMQFDSLFMIKVAESKGLFGDPSEQRKPKREPPPVRPVHPVHPAHRPSQPLCKDSKRFKMEMDRIMAPTYASLQRNTSESRICPRHHLHDTRRERVARAQAREAKKNDARRWWPAATALLLDPPKLSPFSGPRLTRTDPRSSRILCPCRISTLRFPENTLHSQ